MKRVYIIHGWAGYPEECWFLWLKDEMEKHGIKAEVPLMPEAEAPKIDKWVPFLENLVKNPDEDTYLVGHSIGVQTILRYLEKADTKVGGVFDIGRGYNKNNIKF